MNMKKKLLILALPLLLFSCNKPAGELVGTGVRGSFKEANPYGMVFIQRGSFLMGANDQSAIGGIADRSINVSVDAFWMDETEITNDEYRPFVNWVRDSLALRSLVMAGRDEFRARVRNQMEEAPPEVAPLNWRSRIPWNSRDEEIQDILSFMYYGGSDELFFSGRREFNPNVLQYRYEWVNYDQAALMRNRFNVNTGAFPPGATVRVDTSYVDDSGVIRHATITRNLRSRSDLISSRIVNIYPDTMVWVRDFQFAFNDPRMRMYFSHPGYAQYPVVGVTWEQATAFCRWRTDLFNSHNRVQGQDYRLPTKAEWEYAARGGRRLAMYPWGGNYVRDSRGCYMANFKPLPGNYADDTGATTMRVGSFRPNDFGLYDMAGNVSEWTSAAYHLASSTLIHDMNPNFQYDAKFDDPDELKKKVVKGGSWKDVSYYLQIGVDSYEFQNESRSYIGFRCVRSFNGD
jgi:formylglycine-generating enzyme required for sulfatase activity